MFVQILSVHRAVADSHCRFLSTMGYRMRTVSAECSCTTNDAGLRKCCRRNNELFMEVAAAAVSMHCLSCLYPRWIRPSSEPNATVMRGCYFHPASRDKFQTLIWYTPGCPHQPEICCCARRDSLARPGALRKSRREVFQVSSEKDSVESAVVSADLMKQLCTVGPVRS